MAMARRARGKDFLAYGLGRYGPYVVVTHRVAPRTVLKATAGSKGATVGVKSGFGRHKLEVGYNITAKQPYVKHSRTRRKR